VQAGFADFVLSERAEIVFEGQRIARLKAGASRLAPNILFTLPEALDKGARTRIERRVHAHVKDVLSFLLAPICPPERATFSDSSDAAAALRGLLYQLEQGLGSTRRDAVAPQIKLLTAAEHSALRSWGVQLGRASVFVQDMLQPERLRVREALCHAWSPPPAGQRRSSPQLHSVGQAQALEQRDSTTASDGQPSRSFQLQSAWDKQTCLWRGYVAFGAAAVRCDLAERLLVELQKTPEDEVALVQRLLGCEDTFAQALLRAIPKHLRTARPSTRKRRRRKRRPGPSAPASS
jgi:hypothetical protein